MLDFIKAIILGIIEGITEFLPISSTGHLIVAADFMHLDEALSGTFEIVIQLGAVLAVAWFYRYDLLQQARGLRSDRVAQRLWLNLAVAFVPVGVVAFLAHDWIKAVLFSPTVVAMALIGGGVALLAVERWKPRPNVCELSQVSFPQALWIGIVQMLALIPGMSRSATSILGGLVVGLDRPTATAFSFYLALPTLGIATVYDLLTSLDALAARDLLLMAVGLLVALLTSLLVVGWLLRYVTRHDFRPFGYYRIILGILLLIWFSGSL